MLSPKPTRQEQRLSKKEIIFAAALKVFLEKGYEEARIIDIAETAGIGKGTVYQYFSSKQELFFEMFCEKMQQHTQRLKKILDMDASVEKKLRCYFALEFETTACRVPAVEGNGAAVEMIMGVDLVKNEKVAGQIEQMFSDRLTFLQDLIQAGIREGLFPAQDARMSALCALGALSACVFFKYAQKREGKNRQVSEELLLSQLTDFILAGIAKGSLPCNEEGETLRKI